MKRSLYKTTGWIRNEVENIIEIRWKEMKAAMKILKKWKASRENGIRNEDICDRKFAETVEKSL